MSVTRSSSSDLPYASNRIHPVGGPEQHPNAHGVPVEGGLDQGRAPEVVRRVRSGMYVSTNWKWWVERRGSRRWFVYSDGEQLGDWTGPYLGWGKCLPFESLRLAQHMIEHMEWKGFA
jgi:hypothetical protein